MPFYLISAEITETRQPLIAVGKRKDSTLSDYDYNFSYVAIRLTTSLTIEKQDQL